MPTPSALLTAHAGRIASFVETTLRPYLERRRADPTPVRGKEFNDPIWGTLKFYPAEIVVLDSPLLQRLRRIRQLGVAHLVYPAAVHTRLEHSLGVAHQAQQIAASLATHQPAEDGHRGPAYELQRWHIPLLRLTGICHDVGHGLMSHVSENALEQKTECQDIRLDFQEFTESSKKNQLSEIAAYYIFDSPAFLELLEVANNLGSRDLPPVNERDPGDQKMSVYRRAMKNLVIGQKIDDDFPLLHELISGPFDADKLDYMPRDANMCGVPVVTDVTRLIRKVRLVSVPKEGMPRELAATVEDRPMYGITGIARSGARTLDELALGRALLFDKIYRHQKVRAAEAMVASLVNELLTINPSEPAMLPLKILDDEILTLSEETVPRILGLSSAIEPGSDQDAHLRTAIDLAARIRDRNLLVRGYAFSSKMPLDPFRTDPEQRAGIDRLIRLTESPRDRADFVRDLVRRALEIASATGVQLEEIVQGKTLEPYVWISAPIVGDGSGDAIQIGHAFLLGQPSEPIRRADQDYAETRGWSDAYVATRDLGLIFCPQEMSPYVYLAAQTLVRERYGVRTPDSMMAFAKQDPERIRSIQLALVDAGWYAGRERDLVPEPEILRRGDATDRIREIVERLRSYSGPLVQDPETRKTRDAELTKDRVRSWLRQFDHGLVDAAMEMLRAVRYLGRSEVNAALEAFLEAHAEYRDGSVVPLGQPKDSSSVLTYYAGDTAARFGCKIRSLDAALLHGGPIMMVDDYVGLGNASITIIEDWLGEDPTRELGQERGVALPPTAVALLRQAKIAVVFVAGREEGREAVESRARELGIEDFLAFVHEYKLPRITDANVVLDETRRGELLEFCARQGIEGLKAEGRSEDYASERALGYGNDGLLLVSSYNTPTAAVTCLWHEAPGWTPLFPRRKKT